MERKAEYDEKQQEENLMCTDFRAFQNHKGLLQSP